MSANKKQKTEKKVLCLGAGLVAGPGVKYICESGFHVTVASRTLSKAEEIVKGLENGSAVQLDVTDAKQQDKLEELVKSHDLVISLLPWTHHLPVCKMALKHKKDFATTSYIADEMQELDSEFKAADKICLNECGVDPGLDHMSAMQIIHAVHAKGGKIEKFLSYCGGLPCPDDNNNPYGYKFSWSPRGVLLAAKRVAKYLEDGEEKTLDGTAGKRIYDVFLTDSSVPNVGPPLKGKWPAVFESHPNGDSLKYIDIYGIPEIKTIIRGTYRSEGWCPTMLCVTRLKLLEEDAVDAEFTYLDMTATSVGLAKGATLAEVKAKLASFLELAVDDDIVGRLEWLGLFEEKKVKGDTKLDALCSLFLDNKAFRYAEGERDMIAMHHSFIVQNKDGTKEQITSTLVDYGIKNGDTSMSRTVSLPLGIMVRMILEGECTNKGVCRPIVPEIYNPILKEMDEKFGVKFVETTVAL